MPSGEVADQHVVKPAADRREARRCQHGAVADAGRGGAARSQATRAGAPAEVTISSEPTGAELYRDDALLGNTPFPIQKPKDNERIDLEVRLSGYDSKAFSITAITRDELNVTLDKQKAPSRRSSTSRRNDGTSRSRRSPSRRSRGAASTPKCSTPGISRAFASRSGVATRLAALVP